MARQVRASRDYLRSACVYARRADYRVQAVHHGSVNLVRFKMTVLVVVAVISSGAIVIGALSELTELAGIGAYILFLDMLVAGCIVLDPPQQRIRR